MLAKAARTSPRSRARLTISEIAYQCGYKNPYHFSRQIRQFFKHSPSELRKSRGYVDASGVAEGAPDIYF